MKLKAQVSFLVTALLLAALISAGCGGDEGTQALSEITLSPVTMQDTFALYYPVPCEYDPAVTPYDVSPNLSNVVGLSEASIPSGAVSQLAEKGFCVDSGDADQIYQVYQETEAGVFVTVDALLHSFHELFDYALLDMESNYLIGDLKELIAVLDRTVWSIYQGSEGLVRESASRVLAYLGVASRLLGMKGEIPPEMEEAVESEVRLIEEHSGQSTSPLFAYPEDYSQYLPRGHYTGSQDLEDYYKAMTWLGRMGFYPRSGITFPEIQKGRDMTRQAVILVGGLHMSEVDGQSGLRVWESIYQPISFMVGTSDDLDVYGYTELIRAVFGQSFPVSDLEDDAAVDDLIERALAGEEAGADPSSEGEGEGDISLRLFGQRLIPDAFIFQGLVHNEVEGRYMPRGLDVPAALGSERALNILDQFYGEGQYKGYTESMQELCEELDNRDPSLLHSTVYWSWLDTLQVLLKPCGDGYPFFMRGTAWQDRDLYAFLGSWTELRHDTLLYADQSFTAAEAEPQSPDAIDRGYVEPRPEAFARLAATADMLRRGLEDRGLAADAVIERLVSIYELALDLMGMAEKELHNEPLSEGEYLAIDNIGDSLEYLVTFPSEAEEEPAGDSGSSMSLVVDLHTDTNFGEVLEAAVGGPAVYYVIAPVEGRPTLTVGAGLSYYEFIKPAGERLTDEAWQAMVSNGDMPEPPAWTYTFLLW
ncbi:MAG: DUF3160 domain-containing protein [Actinomycetota bacterium]|nr:DUF3160 domain-containing protein [Actinomycetota bacterium]